MTTNAFIMIVAAASFCLVSSMAIDDNKVSGRLESEMLMKMVQQFYNTHNPGAIVEVQDKSNGCDCSGYSCNCCFSANIFSQEIDVCAFVGFIPKELAIEVKLTLDGNVLFDEKVSAHNPPPLCAGIPFLSELASLCLRVYDIEIQDRFHACLDIEVKLFGMVLYKFDLGCFDIPPKQINFVKDEEIKSVVEAQVKSVVEAQIKSVIEEQIKSVVEAQMKSVIEAQINSMIGAQKKSVIGGQVKTAKQ